MTKGRIRKGVEDWYKDFDLGNRFSQYSEEKTDVIEKAITEEHSEIFDLLRSVKTGTPEIDNYIEKVTKPTRFAFIIFIIPVILGAAIEIIQSIIRPFALPLTYAVNHIATPARLTLQQWIIANRRGLVAGTFWEKDAKDLGYHETQIGIFDEATKLRPGFNELLVLLRRKVITEAQFQAAIAEEGVDTNKADELVEARKIDPGLSDLLNIAVREAYDEKAIEDFELDAGFPKEFLADAIEIGVREKWPELLWRAHWQLPGVGQSFEMFQRLRTGRQGPDFTAGNLDTYLRTADIAPFFRDKLTAIAFRPIPRIDVRRLFRADKITYPEMIERNRDFGYNLADATMLAEMVRDEGAEDEREITLSLIQRSYKIKRMNRGEATAALRDLDYGDDTADLILDIVDFQVHEADIDDLERQLEFLFIEGETDEATVRGRLGGEGLTAAEVNLFVQRITIKRNRKIKLPTQGQLEDFYEENIIGRVELESGLSKIGWTRQRITWFVELLDLRIQGKLQKEAERARDAQEKLARRSERRESAITKGEISVRIAEARADIADMKVSARELEEEEEKEALALTILEVKAEIAVMQIDMAIVRRDAA